MNISTFARRVGISPSGVRWYESAGILPPPSRRANGYREYTDDDCSRLRMILALRRLGLTPSEAGELAERCLEHATADAGLVEMLERQRRRIAQEREELERLELELSDLETSIEATDAARRRGARATWEPMGVLFVCNGNSGRSQIAEALLGRYGGDDFSAVSGGTRPKEVHPLTVRVLAEVGIDWSLARAKLVDELLGEPLEYVITLSDSAREECPTVPGRHSSLHWHLDDPALVVGAEEMCLEAFRATRTELTVRLRPFIEIARRAAGRLPAIAGPQPTPS